MFATIADYLGISVLRLVIYAAAIMLALGGAVTIRQHYINKGYHSAIDAVKKQDDRAVDAAKRVEQRAAKCDESNGFWDVITQNCKLGEEEK